MRVYALSDLHLSFTGDKPMDVFGPHWADHPDRMAAAWRERVADEDVVCLPGDFSWARKLDEVVPELSWLATLPGRKVMLKGNHDYWWSSVGKVRRALPDSIYVIQNDSVTLDGVAFGGARGWVDPTLDFSGLEEATACREHPEALYSIEGEEEDRKIYERELGRLRASLATLDADARYRVALAHFPPTSPRMEATAVTDILDRFPLDAVVFGHLHRSSPTQFENPYGIRGETTYYLTSADYVDFAPVLLLETE